MFYNMQMYHLPSPHQEMLFVYSPKESIIYFSNFVCYVSQDLNKTFVAFVT